LSVARINNYDAAGLTSVVTAIGLRYKGEENDEAIMNQQENSPAFRPPPETIHVKGATVACDGGDGDLGHPRVYLSLQPDGRVECPYCDRLYIQDGPAAADH
jgi:uncharacterized Zn-finger protein